MLLLPTILRAGAPLQFARCGKQGRPSHRRNVVWPSVCIVGPQPTTVSVTVLYGHGQGAAREAIVCDQCPPYRVNEAA